MAPMNYLSGKLNPLLALIPPKIREIDFGDCLASDLGRCLFSQDTLQCPCACAFVWVWFVWGWFVWIWFVWVWGLGFGVLDLGFWVLGFWVFGFWVLGFGCFF